VIVRGSPVVNIIVFKHNENKLYNIYSLNVCPELENPDLLEKNDKQSYLVLPHSSKISLDGEFMQVTFFNGRIKLMKLPPILDPIQNEKTQAAA